MQPPLHRIEKKMTQISLFDGTQPFEITKPIRLIEMFAGYGSQALALKYLGVSFEHWAICEWAVKSIQAYKDIHFENDNTDYSAALSDEEITDILFKKGISSNYSEPMTYEQVKRLPNKRTVYNNIVATNNLVSVCNTKGEDLQIKDTDKYTYIMTYSFPCQDLSKAGKGEGMAKGSGTRSGLLWEIERILTELHAKGQENLPQILLMENVPDVIGSKNIKHFADWVKCLDKMGYTSKWEVLNAKDFGVPQNRERCFMVSYLGDYYYDFPTKMKLTKRLKDLLEKSVDEKYYLSDAMLKYFETNNEKQTQNGNGFRWQPNYGETIASCINTREGSRMDDNYIKCDQVGMLMGEKWEKMHDISRPVYGENGLSPTLHTCVGGNLEPKIQVCGNYSPSGHNATRIVDPKGITPTVMENHGQVTAITEPIAYDEQNQYLRQDGCVGTLTTDGSSPKHNNRIIEPIVIGGIGEKKSNGGTQWYQQDRIYDGDCAISIATGFNSYYAVEPSIKDYRIRKLTPRECFRLMGVKDEDFDKVAKHQSNSSLYHLAGDSIVTNVLSAIFKQMGA